MTTEPAPTATSDDAASQHREPFSFVRRTARLTNAQQRAWDNNVGTMLIDVPRDSASTSVDPEYRLDVDRAFGRTAPLVVEIGTGLGECIVDAAAADPGRNYLGIEVYTPGLAMTIMKVEKAAVTNVRLIQANAPEVLETTLDEASVSELWSFFADPWHKKRHYKRRMFRPSFVAQVERVLSDDGLLRIATDWENYAEHIKKLLATAPELIDLDGPRLWSSRFEGRSLTSFEQKAHNAGREVRDLTYRRRLRD